MLALQRTDRSRPLTPRNGTTEWELLRNGQRVAVISPVKAQGNIIDRILAFRQTTWEARTQDGKLICRGETWTTATDAAKARFKEHATPVPNPEHIGIQGEEPALQQRPPAQDTDLTGEIIPSRPAEATQEQEQSGRLEPGPDRNEGETLGQPQEDEAQPEEATSNPEQQAPADGPENRKRRRQRKNKNQRRR